ncbi:MAG: M3 family metallopeptidase, partial [Bacteroidota bacterium]|nr:M3 family metallopeptidase [Bacteroidota bacterium]
EVLDTDAFQFFKEKGIFNKTVAKSFHDNILTKGGKIDQMEIYKNFLVREPKIDALLDKRGLK